MNPSRASVARVLGALVLLVPSLGCAPRVAPVHRAPPSVVAATRLAEGAAWTSRAIALPGAPGPVRMDYLAYDPATRALWIPAGNTGRVDVLDTTTDAFRTIDGFATVAREVHGTRRVLGPSAVELAAGVAFVGNRADASIARSTPARSPAARASPCRARPTA